MKLDKFANPIFNETDIFDALYAGHQSVLSTLVVEDNYEFSQFTKTTEFSFHKPNLEILDLPVEDYDKINQQDWYMPLEYYNFDVYAFCISKCKSDIEIQRVTAELDEFNNRNLIQLLQWLKYFVDTCLAENIVWGVGRGSSVASFVLYLLNVHRIHSIKYNLDWREFLR
jgi:DNA polymerase III alpha subunit